MDHITKNIRRDYDKKRILNPVYLKLEKLKLKTNHQQSLLSTDYE